MTAVATEEDDFADFQAAPPTTTLPAPPQSSSKSNLPIISSIESVNLIVQ